MHSEVQTGGREVQMCLIKKKLELVCVCVHMADLVASALSLLFSSLSCWMRLRWDSLSVCRRLYSSGSTSFCWLNRCYTHTQNWWWSNGSQCMVNIWYGIYGKKIYHIVYMTKHTKCAAVYTILKSVFCWSQMKLEMHQERADPIQGLISHGSQKWKKIYIYSWTRHGVQIHSRT